MLRGPFLHRPLEKWLGVLEQRMYQQARADQNWAFELVGDLWLEDSIGSESEEETDDGLGVPTTSKHSVERERTKASTRSGSEQVQSDMAARVVAKLLFKAKGPYQVVESVGKGSYRIQRLPFCQGLG